MQSRQVGDYNPVEAEGRSGDRILCFQVHGDAAFAAQVRIPCSIVGPGSRMIVRIKLGTLSAVD